MTGKRKRILIVFVIICLIGVGILVYRILHIPGGQLAYETIWGRACLVSGLRTRCANQRYDPDLPSLPPHSSFLDYYEHTGLLKIGGEESVLLTEAALVHHLNPRWSPDRQVIAYKNTDPDNYGICFADADGNHEQCYQIELRCVGDLSWSPDGKRIAYSAIHLAGTGCLRYQEGWDVYIFDLDTFSSTVFATDAYEPSWSPDGQQIAFASYRDGNSEIYTIDVDGSNLSRITNNPAGDSSPEWSPDGERIAFVSDRGGDTVRINLFDEAYKKRIYVVNAEGGRARMLISRPFDSIERFVWGE